MKLSRITHTATGNYLSAVCELLSSMPPKDAKELARKHCSAN